METLPRTAGIIAICPLRLKAQPHHKLQRCRSAVDGKGSMSHFQFRGFRLENFLCLDALTLPVAANSTALFAQNVSGKTTLLNALAIGFAALQSGSTMRLKIIAEREPRIPTLGERGLSEAVGHCEQYSTAAAGETESVKRTTAVIPSASTSRISNQHRPILEALAQIRLPLELPPPFARYGVDRLQPRRNRGKSKRTWDPWSAYDSSLDSSVDEVALLEWLHDEALPGVALGNQSTPKRLLHQTVEHAAVRTTPSVGKPVRHCSALRPIRGS